MIRKNLLLKSIILCISFTGASWCQSAQPEGELLIYAMATQINTIARRTFRDDEGRITKEIYYSLKDTFFCSGGGEVIQTPDPRLPKLTLCKTAEPPYTEDMLAVQSIRIYTYDDRGRKIKEDHYAPGMNLQHKWETEYDDNKGRREIKYTPEGIKTYEIR